MAVLSQYILRGDRASQPAAADAGAGALYCVTDEDLIIERSTGSAWEQFSPDAPTASEAWTSVFKTADETIQSDATLNVDNTLVVPMLANKKYIMEVAVFFSSTNAADIKFRNAGPAAPTRVSSVRHSEPPGSATESAIIEEAYSASDLVFACVTGEMGYLHWWMNISNGANAGDFQVMWSQNSSQAEDTTVRAGSFIRYRQLD